MSRPPLLYQEGNCPPDMHSQLLKAREFPCAKPLPCNYGCKTTSIWRLATGLQKKNFRIPFTRFRVQGVSGMQAIKVLRKDHSTVRSLFDKLERTARSSHEKKNDLFEQIRRELQLHMRAEEEIFYPALKAFNEEGWRMVAEALKDHRDIDQLLTQISRLNPSNKNYEDKVEALFENVDHHLEEEDGEIFPFAEENCSAQQLEDLGRQIEERKKTLDRQMAA